MRHLIIMISLAIILPTGASADYTASIDGTCDGGQIVLAIGAMSIDFENGEDEVGILVHRSTLGTCDSDEIINLDQPLALPADGESITHDLVTPVLPGVGYKYWVSLLLADGSESGPAGNGPNLEVVGCGDWAITRGTLGYGDGINPTLESCACWYPAYTLEIAAGLAWQAYVGQMVEIRGEAWIDEMPGGYDIEVTDIRTVESCQSPVATAATSWSSVKALYR